jgi:hypothetical protein
MIADADAATNAYVVDAYATADAYAASRDANVVDAAETVDVYTMQFLVLLQMLLCNFT